MSELSIPLFREGAANRTRYFFTLSGSEETFKVIAFESVVENRHALSTDYTLDLTLSSDRPLQGAILLNQKGRLSLFGGHRGVQEIHGQVTQVEARGRNLDEFEYRLQLSSPLFGLKLNRQSRVFLRRTVVEIAQEVLEGAGVSRQNISFETRHDYPQREFVAQFQESDYDFLSRQLAYWGLFFYFEQTAESWKLIIRDHVQELPRLADPDVLHFRQQSGQSRSDDTLYQVQLTNTLLTRDVQLNDHNYRTPSTGLNVQQGSRADTPGQGVDYHYGEHQQTPEQGGWLAQVRVEALDWQRCTCQAETDCCALAPGQAFTLADHPDPALNGDYMVVSVSHRGDQSSGDAGTRDGVGHHYSNRLVLVRNGVLYRHPLPDQMPRMRGPLSARVESSGGDYPHIDEQGRYKVRLCYDLSDKGAAEASHRVRMMQPYSGDGYGLHFPPHAGTEVALGHLNGDPDRPFILGALPNPQTPSPVNADNASQHILRTWGSNELLFEDRAGEERIELFTRNRQNVLSLDARKESHQIRLASEQGDMKIEAGKTILQRSGDSHTLESGNNHEVTVENNQRLMTKNQEIQLDAATDIEFKAKQNIRAQAEAQNVEISAGRNSVQTTQQDASWEVKQGDMKMQVESGRFELRVAKAITLLGEGGGNIHLGQAGCRFEIDTGGNLNLSGKTLNMTFQTINLKGQNIGNN
ncbi:MAG: type VI secretion system tip protein TssI/VgrG [Candidatus Thiodiazotropha sp.]